MKQQRRRAPKGRRATPPAQSVQELLGVSIDRHHAYLAGHQGALFDELNASLQSAKDDDPVTIPQWVFDVVYDFVMEAMIDGTKGRGKHAKWWRKYRDDLCHWHRYARVRQALKDRRATSPDVYEVVARELVGTAFAAKPSGIKNSVEEVVTKALKNGEHARFYRSIAAHVYEFLLNAPAQPGRIPGSGETYGHIFLGKSTI